MSTNLTRNLLNTNLHADRLNQLPHRSWITSSRRIAQSDLVATHLDHLLSDVCHPQCRHRTLEWALDGAMQVRADTEAQPDRFLDDFPLSLEVLAYGCRKGGDRVRLAKKIRGLTLVSVVISAVGICHDGRLASEHPTMTLISSQRISPLTHSDRSHSSYWIALQSVSRAARSGQYMGR